MSENSSNNPLKPLIKKRRLYSWRMLIGLPAWIFTSYVAVQLVLIALLWVVKKTGLFVIDNNNPAYQTSVAAAVYALTLLIAIGIPWILRRRKTTLVDIGLTRLPSWMDILLSPAGLVIYLLASALLIAIFSAVMPGFDTSQAQEVGFQNLSGQTEYLLAFLTLIVIAPVAEEILFRGYLFGKLKQYVPVWAAIIATSILFGAAHGQWNVAIDTFALSIIMCSLREVTGSIWAGILLHMMKNGIAFYFLFINPSILNTLGG